MAYRLCIINVREDYYPHVCASTTRLVWTTCTMMSTVPKMAVKLNTLRPRQNGRHFADDIFKCIFLNENASISTNISLKFVPKGRISNIPTLVQIMAWRRLGDKPLSEPMMVSLLTHICVTRPQWVNHSLIHARFPGMAWPTHARR